MYVANNNNFFSQPGPPMTSAVSDQWGSEQLFPQRTQQFWTHTHQVGDRLSEADCVHGHSHGIGKGKDQSNGTAQFWTQTPTDQEVGPAWDKKKKKSSGMSDNISRLILA